jgi:16S rRNA (guanine(966)-N(2))-methyltransferase RsmD
MRITGGYLKGRVLKGKVNNKVRPTTDMVRESLFNILDNLIDFKEIEMLDLFAGTGIVGMEAISRGAGIVSFNDNYYPNIKSIEFNLKEFEIENYKIQKGSYLKYINNCERRFNLIYADPPYEKGYYNEIVKSIENKDLLEKDGYLILESLSNELINTAGFDLVKERKIGNTKLTILSN